MKNRLFHCQQQSDLWLAARRGRVTGSRIGDMLAPPISRASSRGPKGTEAAAKEAYRKELVVERIYKQCVNHFGSRAMQEGIEREPFARMLYEAEVLGDKVRTVGFALHYEWDWFGCSADGLCGQIGGVELKSPTEMVHDSYCQNLELLIEEYKGQALGNLVCFPQRQWWDLYSFSPFAPDAMKLVGYRFHRSDWADTLKEIETVAPQFNAEVEATIASRGLPPTEFDIMPPETEEPDPVASAYLTDEDFAAMERHWEGGV